MAPRTRFRIVSTHPVGYLRRHYGYAPHEWDEHGSEAIVTGYDRCIDDTDSQQGDGRRLRIHHYRSILPKVSFIPQEPVPTIQNYQGWMPHWLRNIGDEHFYDNEAFGLPTIDQVAVETMAKTNPSSPSVDLPVAFLELGDIVKLIQSVGTNLIKRKLKGNLKPSFQKGNSNIQGDTGIASAAEANLGYQFGIAPVISDLSDLMQIQDLVAKRVQVLEKLRMEGSIARTYRKKEHPYTATQSFSGSNRVMNSAGLYITSQGWRALCTSKRWGFARWQADPAHQLPVDDAAMRRLAREAVLGLTVDPSTFWELIPFSWLVDYFIKIGAYFAAHRNIVPAICTELLVCTENTMITDHDPFQYYNMVFGPSQIRQTSRKRDRVMFTTPAAQLPFFNEQQMSIIASLGVLKAR